MRRGKGRVNIKMRDISEIKNCPRLGSIEDSVDGFSAIISMPTWIGSLICSCGGGWEHVSIRPFKKNINPSWDDMCRAKDIFWDEDEAVIQVHPAKKDYVNNVENCLHLWRCTYKEMVLPPSCFVGLRKGQTIAEAYQEIKAAYKAAGEEFTQ